MCLIVIMSIGWCMYDDLRDEIVDEYQLKLILICIFFVEVDT